MQQLSQYSIQATLVSFAQHRSLQNYISHLFSVSPTGPQQIGHTCSFCERPSRFPQRTYHSTQNHYLSFCKAGNVRSVPANKALLCHCVSYLAKQGLRHRTIKVYLSAVRFLHTQGDYSDPFQPFLHRVEYTSRGIKQREAKKSKRGREKTPNFSQYTETD